MPRGPAFNSLFKASKTTQRAHQPLRGVKLSVQGQNPPARDGGAPEVHTEAEGYSDPFPWEPLRKVNAARFLASLPDDLKKGS